MRELVVLCLVAAAWADQLGYNYQPVVHASDNAPSFTGPQEDADYATTSNSAPSYVGLQENVAEASHITPSFAPQGEIDKEFYSFSSNEENFNDPAASNQLTNATKQGLRVVLIKGPENHGLEDAAIAQNTNIYVLNKQADIGDLAIKLNSINKNNKPEVHFVKYLTPEDAANAQNTIQGQYDSLGGLSQSYNGGVAPVLDFASKAPVFSHVYNFDASASISSYIPPASGVAAFAPGKSYLPASFFLRLR